MKFETALQELQMIVKQLEAGDLTLEAGLENYEKGIKLIRDCQATLKVAEQKINTLNMNQTEDASTEG